MAENLAQNSQVAGNISNSQTNNAPKVLPQVTSMLCLDSNGQYCLHPYYFGYFSQLYQINEILLQTVNKKWTDDQKNGYIYFVQSHLVYIRDYVIGMQVYFYEDYQNWLQQVKFYNPVGYDLYEKQLDYLQKKSQGYDWKQEKKRNKDPNAPKNEQKKKQQKPVQQKQKVIIRQNDPQINIEKLMNNDWDSNKYLSTSFLAKENANIVFIGHVDSGKSTLTGNIMLKKQFDQQQWRQARQDSEMNKMDSWAQAGISDVIPEQRKDGKTRQFAKLNFSLNKKRFTLFDAPGHKNYVPNMIMGACQADIAVLIISAKEGEFQSGFQKDGQTKEHAMLAKALGVIQLIVVVTKMGVAKWSQERFDQIKQQVVPYLQNSCGFHNVTFIPVQSIDNVNIHERITDSWYKGPCFLEYLDDVKLPERKPLGPLRIPVIDKFKDVGSLYVYGKIQSGTIIEEQSVTILPERTQLLIKQIYNAKDERLPFAMAGQNVKIKVKGIDEDEIYRGAILCSNLNYCQESAQFKANISILQLPEQKKLVSSGYECVMHMHAIANQVEIVKVDAKIQKTANGQKKIVSTFLKAGQKGICVFKVQKPVCLEKYDFMPSLGRFTLRDEGKTIGYGEIIGIKPAKKLFKQQEEQLKKGLQKVQQGIAKIQVSNQ